MHAVPGALRGWWRGAVRTHTARCGEETNRNMPRRDAVARLFGLAMCIMLANAEGARAQTLLHTQSNHTARRATATWTRRSHRGQAKMTETNLVKGADGGMGVRLGPSAAQQTGGVRHPTLTERSRVKARNEM
jgi:hypothetical protein